jgi:hypothetical protein
MTIESYTSARIFTTFQLCNWQHQPASSQQRYEIQGALLTNCVTIAAAVYFTINKHKVKLRQAKSVERLISIDGLQL